ncbi:MAG: hypothetical protein M1549_03100 [Candidatus Dependentiae bacterium]|nr:hypothetical protein [Candidatus Dependentiae bacterium]
MTGTIQHHARLHSREKLIVSKLLQFLCIVFTISVLSIFFARVNSDNYIRDPYAPIYALTPQEIAKFGSIPTEVTAGLFVRDVPKFDPVKGNFTLDVVVWFLFDPRLVSLERLRNFYFEKSEVISKAEPQVSIKGDNLFARFDMRLKLDVVFDYREFPFDDHRLNLILVHEGFTPAEVSFEAVRGNLELSPLMSILGWHCFDWRVAPGFMRQKFAMRERTTGETYYPTIVFSLDFERVGIRHIISIFIPLLLIIFIALFTFSIDPLGTNAGSIVTLSATAVTALIAYRFVIEAMSPGVGYLLCSDYVFLVSIIMTCAIFFINVFWAMSARGYKTAVVLAAHGLIILAFFLSV